VDYLRSCQRGFWRFFPTRPDILTEGFHYFAPEGTDSIGAPHSFGSAGWLKDGMTSPEYPTGQLLSAGTQWYNGQSPEPLPPDQQIFDPAAFSADLTYPPAPAVRLRGGFDERCYVVFHPGVDIDINEFLRPDITDCCWQRVLARLCELLTEPYATALADFNAAVALLWPDYRVVIFPPDTTLDRWALIEGPTFQILLRVGTQEWSEIFTQAWHLNLPAHNYGAFGTSTEWFEQSSAMVDQLIAIAFDPAKPVYFVGHSRGGAVLWILARRMAEVASRTGLEVLTFGCPRVGDSRMIEQRSIRRMRHVIHRQDVIPLVPPNPILWPALRLLFAAVTIDAFASWEPFPLYQITGDGWGNGMEPSGTLPVNIVAAYIRLLLNGQPIAPIEQHSLSSYVAALGDCCEGRAFPFPEQFWIILFGADALNPGGGMWGGIGDRPGSAGVGGLAIGGPDSMTQGSGGLEIGGAGDQYDGIITETNIPIISESGSYLIVE
jgi:pimeloyl-ACP methyl ester carboxylesterase